MRAPDSPLLHTVDKDALSLIQEESAADATIHGATRSSCKSRAHYSRESSRQERTTTGTQPGKGNERR